LQQHSCDLQFEFSLQWNFQLRYFDFLYIFNDVIKFNLPNIKGARSRQERTLYLYTHRYVLELLAPCISNLMSSRILKQASTANSELTSFRTKCSYCGTVARFYPYFGYCKICGVKICLKCIKSRELYIKVVFGKEVFDEFRCHVHRTEPPLRITMDMYNEMTHVIISGEYNSESESGSSETTDSSEESSE